MAQDDVHGRLLRLVMPHGAYHWLEWPPDSPSWLSRSRGQLQPKVLSQGYPVGVRPDRYRCHFLALDIDFGSCYHPSQDPSAIDRICGVLANHGIERLLRVRSSSSGGLHLWAPLPEQGTRELARWLEQRITAAAFHVAKGHLELFPNLALPGSAHNGIRLPLIAPDSWILDDDLDPVHQSIEGLCEEWTACLACNEEFTLGLPATPPAPSGVRGGKPAEAWERLSKGWSGHGQTYALAKDAAFVACCEGLRGVALQSRMCKLMAQAPGCQAWSKHWAEIASGKYGNGLAKYYSKLGADFARNKPAAERKTKERSSRNPAYNKELSDRRKQALVEACQELENSGEFFQCRTHAINRLLEIVKMKSGRSMSKSTIYKIHLDLVHNLVTPESEAPLDP